MKINYYADTFYKEERILEVKNPKNVFLKGKERFSSKNTLFGIWDNKEGLIIVTIKDQKEIRYDYSCDKNIYTECDIRQYLQQNEDVVKITKQEFKNVLKKTRKLIKI